MFHNGTSMGDDLYHDCTIEFVLLLLITGRCYDAETSAILLLLKRAFA